MSDDCMYALTCWTCGRMFRTDRDGWLVATPPQPVMVLRAPGLGTGLRCSGRMRPEAIRPTPL